MSDIIDLGGAPANEDCAQLGHTPDFERLNRLEVATYRATDPVTRRQITVAPDVGWSYNPGAAAWQPDPKRYTGDLAKLAKKELP